MAYVIDQAKSIMCISNKFRKIIALLFVTIFILSFSHTIFGFTAQERTCATLFYACEANKKNSVSCSQMKDLAKDLKLNCKYMNKIKLEKVFACQAPAKQLVDSKLPNWLVVSWDLSDPRIYAFCDTPGAETARRCAYNKCKEMGGKSCKSACDSSTGTRLRACRLGFQTYIASSEYGRLGCGTRYIKSGAYTPESYTNREMQRCKNASKTNDCLLRKMWQQ